MIRSKWKSLKFWVYLNHFQHCIWFVTNAFWQITSLCFIGNFISIDKTMNRWNNLYEMLGNLWFCKNPVSTKKWFLRDRRHKNVYVFDVNTPVFTFSQYDVSTILRLFLSIHVENVFKATNWRLVMWNTLNYNKIINSSFCSPQLPFYFYLEVPFLNQNQYKFVHFYFKNWVTVIGSTYSVRCWFYSVSMFVPWPFGLRSIPEQNTLCPLNYFPFHLVHC